MAHCALLDWGRSIRTPFSVHIFVCVQVFWCNQCARAVAWSVLSDAESPAAVHELMYVFFGDGPKRLAYDNGCNLMNYMLNRDPVKAKDVEVFIDALHAKNHKACARSYSTGTSPQPCRWVCCLSAARRPQSARVSAHASQMCARRMHSSYMDLSACDQEKPHVQRSTRQVATPSSRTRSTRSR